MDPLVYEALTTLAVAALTVLLTYLRQKYAKFGDEIIAQMGKLVQASKGIEAVYQSKELVALNAQLELDLAKVKATWETGEITGWSSLMNGVADFYKTYNAAKALADSLSPKK